MVRLSSDPWLEYRWPLLYWVVRPGGVETEPRSDFSPAPDPGHFTTEPVAELDGSLMQRQLDGSCPELKLVAMAATAMAIVATERQVH